MLVCENNLFCIFEESSLLYIVNGILNKYLALYCSYGGISNNTKRTIPLKNILFISFDFLRKSDPKTSLAIGSILAYLHSKKDYGLKFKAFHHTVDMYTLNVNTSVSDILNSMPYTDYSSYQYIAISAYVWSEKYLNDLMFVLKRDYSFTGEFVLGGYQISYSNNPELEYPLCNLFIDGYGEQSVYEILIGKHKSGVIKSVIDYNSIPSPYLSKIITVNPFQAKVRIETKRGCPYNCTFCAHKDLTNKKVLVREVSMCFDELLLFKNLKVQKINILDPIFNAGNGYLEFLEEMVRIGLDSEISIQVRFETIFGDDGDRFLDLCGKLNIHLEFGLQTASREESILIKRKNRPEKIISAMNKLNSRGISYEVSLIYGLPSQTVESFKDSIKFIQRNGCDNITAFPLMLLKGTELFLEKEKYNFKEKKINDYDIPVVVSSTSFNEKNWREMKELAELLSYDIVRV